jgi:hypothetical protein
MPFSADDVDQLVAELGASLGPQYEAFASAAHAVLGEIDCNHLGVGLAYRLLRTLQRSHYDYPTDPPCRYEPRHHRAGATKLASLPARAG